MPQRTFRAAHLIHPFGRIPAQPATLAAAGVFALVGVCMAVAAGPVRAGDGAPQRVVALHGLARGAGSMDTLAEGLREHGFEVYNLDYPSTEQTPDELLELLATQVEECCAGDSGRTHFVGHSLGGILIRALLAKNPPPTLGRVVLLAPPNHGSEIVDTLGGYAIFEAILGPTAVELGTDPDSLPNRLPPPDYEIGIIAGNQSLNPVGAALLPDENDGAVSIEATRVEGARDFLVVDANHTFIMNEPDVIRQVVHFLERGSFDGAAGSGTSEENSDAGQ